MSGNKRVRQDVIDVFAELGSAASAALPALTEIRTLAKGDLRQAAAAAIEAIQRTGTPKATAGHPVVEQGDTLPSNNPLE